MLIPTESQFAEFNARQTFPLYGSTVVGVRRNVLISLEDCLAVKECHRHSLTAKQSSKLMSPSYSLVIHKTPKCIYPPYFSPNIRDTEGSQCTCTYMYTLVINYYLRVYNLQFEKMM